ncbi:hypothetical protein ACIFQM_03465 [Paenibacillus sp. NRS-1782]|uniref:hypothetical protein n=1 Tax=unclassified Paenibacillus TaxID=185978 RepID=UPI003D2A5900
MVAKFDDDDYYSPFYLKEQVKELKRTKSDIVGKHSCLVYLSASNLRKCRKKGFKTYATSPFNYVYQRRQNKKSHTWRAGDDFYIEGSRLVVITDHYRLIADKEV